MPRRDGSRAANHHAIGSGCEAVRLKGLVEEFQPSPPRPKHSSSSDGGAATGDGSDHGQGREGLALKLEVERQSEIVKVPYRLVADAGLSLLGVPVTDHAYPVLPGH